MPALPDIHHFTVQSTHNGVPLVAFVKEHLHLSGSKAKALLDKRAVWVNGKRVWMAKHRLKKGDRVEVRQTRTSSSPSPTLQVLYEDDWLIGIHKPAGLISESHTHSVETVLRKQRSDTKLRALHRLDRDTSGVLLFSKGPSCREAYIDCFRNKQVDKIYAALLAGTLPEHSVTVNTPLEGKEAETRFYVEKVHQGFMRVRCRLITGRTHQIRKHAASLKCRVLGDTTYQSGPDMTQLEKKVTRHMLHAESISLQSPHQNHRVEIQAPWPKDFQAVAEEFKLK